MGDTIKKIVGSILLSLLLLGIVPVGIIYLATPVIADGEFIKIQPEKDMFVYSLKEDESSRELDERRMIVGANWDTYIAFDLSRLDNKTPNEISSVKLRLAATWLGAGSDGSNQARFNVAYLDNNNWNDGTTWNNKPRGNETNLTYVTYSSAGVLEIDLTEPIKEMLGSENQTITLRLSAADHAAAPIQFASSGYEDPSYRPYLKILVNDAVDTDPPGLNKTYLDTNVYVSEASPNASGYDAVAANDDLLCVDNGSATYLKFNIDPKNIQGAITDAKIQLRPKNKSSTMRMQLYYINNNDWNGSMTYNSRPAGETELIETAPGYDTRSGISFDVTSLIRRLFSEKMYTASFILACDDPESTESVLFYSNNGAPSNFAPGLSIDVSDDPDIVAIYEAFDNIAGDNPSLDEVYTNLPGGYEASNGRRVMIRWSGDTYIPIISDISDIISSSRSTGSILGSGRINPPHMFQKPISVDTTVTLTCGDDSVEREVSVTLMPQGSETRLQQLRDLLTFKR